MKNMIVFSIIMFCLLMGFAACTSLMKATEEGDQEAVKSLIAKGADVNEADKNGRTPLLKAVVRGHFEVVQILLKEGADINHTDNLGNTALHLSIMFDEDQIALLLVENGADLSIQTKYGDVSTIGFTPLMWAVKNCNVETARILLEAGADVNVQSQNGYTPLILATKQSKMTQLLIEKGADVRMATKFGDTALHKAAYYGQRDIIELLINNGADIEVQNNKNLTPKQVAEQAHNENVLDLLRPESERLAWDKMKSMANDPVLLQDFLEQTSDPDLYKEAKRLMEVLQISLVHSSGAGDRLVVADIQPLEGGPVASATVSYYDGYITLKGEYSFDSIPVSGTLPNPLAEWGDGSVVRFSGEITLKGITFDGDPDYPLAFLMLKETGLVYLAGNGTVVLLDGTEVVLPTKR
jgi:ankyrin repeat protein